MKKISIKEIETVYKMYDANPSKPLNNMLNKGRLNENLKCGHVSVRLGSAEPNLVQCEALKRIT